MVLSYTLFFHIVNFLSMQKKTYINYNIDSQQQIHGYQE